MEAILLPKRKTYLGQIIMTDPAQQFATQFANFVTKNGRHTLAEAASLSVIDDPTEIQHKMFFCMRYIEAVSELLAIDVRDQASSDLARRIMKLTSTKDRALPII